MPDFHNQSSAIDNTNKWTTIHHTQQQKLSFSNDFFFTCQVPFDMFAYHSDAYKQSYLWLLYAKFTLLLKSKHILPEEIKEIKSAIIVITSHCSLGLCLFGQ